MTFTQSSFLSQASRPLVLNTANENVRTNEAARVNALDVSAFASAENSTMSDDTNPAQGEQPSLVISMSGGGGDDTLKAGGARNILTGGNGNDTFVFAAVSDSPPSRDETTLDQIVDFTHGQDHIDLSAIADSFTTGAFTGVAGQVHVVASGTTGFDKVELDSDGNGSPDLAVLVNHQTSWQASDFVL
jgi:hypothetical protein